MKRYATIIGRTGVHRSMVDIWIVVRTDGLAEAELLGRGFIVVPAELTDDEVRARYGVATIYTLAEHQAAN